MFGSLVAHINLSRLRANARALRSVSPHQRLWGVIKANAYGHGMVECASALIRSPAVVDGLAVARVGEAAALVEAGLSTRVLVLGGAHTDEEFAYCAAHGIEMAVHNLRQLEWLDALPVGGLTAPVWLKLDSGMGRLGFLPSEFAAVVHRASACLHRHGVPYGLMTHLARADEPTHAFTTEQLASFDGATAGLPGERSVANSAGLLAWPSARRDWARPGLTLYGVSPFDGQTGVDHGCQPVMSLATRLVSVKDVPAGSPVGYGGTWHAPQTMRLGIAAVGYADGFTRFSPSGTPVLVNGVAATIAGRVSMDLIALDLRNVPGADVGDKVILWGDGLSVEKVAASVGTIPYELLAGLGRRVDYVFSE